MNTIESDKLELRLASKIKIPRADLQKQHEFLQRMLNRLQVGYLRYGSSDKQKKYLTRLKLELKAYQKTGNLEYLYNIANYAVLESLAPEHPKFNFDDSVDSVSRHRIG